jgi:hypothetical protein
MNRGDGFSLKIIIDVREIPKKGFSFSMTWLDHATTAFDPSLHSKVGLLDHDRSARISVHWFTPLKILGKMPRPDSRKI